MDKKSIQLRCRQCNSIVDTKLDKMNKCNCGKCGIKVKGDTITISSEVGIGGYTIIQNGQEYVLISKEELEETNG